MSQSRLCRRGFASSTASARWRPANWPHCVTGGSGRSWPELAVAFCESERLSAIGAATRPDSESVDHTLRTPTVEDRSPLIELATEVDKSMAACQQQPAGLEHSRVRHRPSPRWSPPSDHPASRVQTCARALPLDRRHPCPRQERRAESPRCQLSADRCWRRTRRSCEVRR